MYESDLSKEMMNNAGNNNPDDQVPNPAPRPFSHRGLNKVAGIAPTGPAIRNQPVVKKLGKKQQRKVAKLGDTLRAKGKHNIPEKILQQCREYGNVYRQLHPTATDTEVALAIAKKFNIETT